MKSKKEYNREYNKRNKEKISEKQKAYKLKNKETISKYISEYNKIYKKKNKETLSLKNREYNQKPERKNARKQYRKSEICKEYNNNYSKNRRKIDPNFKLASLLRTRLRNLLKNKSKIGSAVRDLGCSVDELKIHLESKFYKNKITGEKMSWENHGAGHGRWQIDHIEELHTVDLTNRNDYLRVCNFKNLQPLWFEDHVEKGMINMSKTKIEVHPDGVKEVEDDECPVCPPDDKCGRPWCPYTKEEQ